MLEDRTNYLIIVRCEDVQLDDLEEDMRLYMETNTYLIRDSRWFGETLLYAMPLKSLSEIEREANGNIREADVVPREDGMVLQAIFQEI